MSLLHITNGDHAAARLAESGLPGEVFAWSDILFAGPQRDVGWPRDEALTVHAAFIADTFALEVPAVLAKLQTQYAKLRGAFAYNEVVLWFDACLMDQTTLVHLLTCLDDLAYRRLQLICIGDFPGIADFHGLGQLRPEDFVRLYPSRRPLSPPGFALARRADQAFAQPDVEAIRQLAGEASALLPFLPAACGHWLEELPDADGLGKLDRLIIEAIGDGEPDFPTVYRQVAARDSRSRFWGDTWLEAKYRKLLVWR